MDHNQQDRQIPGKPSPAAADDRGDHPPQGGVPGTRSTPPAAAHPSTQSSCIELPKTGPDSISTCGLGPELLRDPQFPTTTIPARERLSGPAPVTAYRGDQFGPHRPAGESSVEQLRWAHCPDDGHLHLLQPAEVVVAATGDHAEALCGQALPAEGLILTPLTNGSSGALCMTCVDGIPFPSSDSGPRDTP